MKSSLQNTFRSLRHRNLRAFFFGQGLSLIGTWITTVASSWLVYRLTNSEFLLGVVACSAQLPMALVTPFAGVLVDHWDRRKVLIWTQGLSMLQSFVLAALAFSGVINVYHIIFLNICQAVVNAFDMPARQAFLPSLIEERMDLPNAIALQAAMFHGSRLIGPAIAGILIAITGESSCFLIDGFSYLAVLFSLFSIKAVSAEIERHSNLKDALLDGARTCFQPGPIRSILTLVSLIALFGTSQITLLPVFAREVLKGQADLYGFLMASSGVGAFAGALLLASRTSNTAIGKFLSPAPILLGIMLILFSLSRSVYLGAGTLLVAGFSMVTLLAGCNTMIQLRVDDRRRGRVLSFYGLSFLGMMPLGGLLAGSIAHVIGAPETVLISGVICTGIGAWYLPKIRSW